MKLLFIGARLFDDISFYLKKKGIKSILTESNKDSPNLELADKAFIVPRGMEKPMEIAISEKVDGIIPLIGIDTPLMEVAIMKENIESKYNIPVIASNVSAITISSDKVKTKEFFNENQISTPNYLIAKDINDISNEMKNNCNFDFPIVLKQAKGQGGKDIKIANDFKEVKEYFSKFDQALCEEFIEGSEISIEVLAGKKEDKKEYLALTPVYKGETTLEGIHPLNKVRSAPCEIKDLDNDYIGKIATKITTKLDCEGTIDIDFIYSKKHQKLFAIEINTRPSGTRYLTAATTGINPLIKLIDMVTGDFCIDFLKDEIKSYFALEIPVGKYNGPLTDGNLKKFTKNSWVVHGPSNYERLTISGETKIKAYEIYDEILKIE